VLVTELMRGEYIDKRENILLVGNSGTGKSHVATALGIVAGGQGKRVRFFRVTELITQLMEAVRYEVKIVLGKTDPSHIVRCIEYWDVERRRYPGYEHIAVLIAEDVTSRFLNVLSLMAGNVPMIAIQLNALKIGEHLVLDFVHVLNQTSLRNDDTNGGSGTEVPRSFWDAKVGPEIMSIAEGVCELAKEFSDREFIMACSKSHIAISEPGTRCRLAFVHPKQRYAHLSVKVAELDEWHGRFEEDGLPLSKRMLRLRVTLSPNDLKKHRDLLKKFL